MLTFSIMTSTNVLLFILIILILFLILYLVKQNFYFKEIIQKQNEENYERDNKIKELKKQINDFGISSYLQKALNKNLKTFSEKKMSFLDEQYHRIMNSYKILYFRKISNLILDHLFKIHGTKFSKTEAIFLNNEKPEFKQNKFPIICVDKSFDKIQNVDKYLINLIIDFLMYMKDFTSSIIHLSELSYNFQIEILSQYIGHKVEIIDNKYYINTEELINLMFPENNTNNKLKDEQSIKKNLNINIIDNNHEISTTINNNISLKNNINEPEEYSTEISDNGKSGNGYSRQNQNGKSEFSKNGQRNNEKKDSNNINKEKNINRSLTESLTKDDIEIKDIHIIDNQKSSISGTSKAFNIKKNIIKTKGRKKIKKSEVNKMNKEKDEITNKEEEEENEKADDLMEDLQKKKSGKNSIKKKDKKNNVKKEEKKDKVQTEEEKSENDEEEKERKKEVKINAKNKEDEKDNIQRNDTEDKKDEDKKRKKKLPKKLMIKKKMK